MLSPPDRGQYPVRVGVHQRIDQVRRLVRSAITDLFDQRRPFGRLALTHVLMTAGDTMFAVSLAGSLFFSISPTAAKDKVLLYLLLTMGPFAVVAPALGPVIDRSRGARRAMVVASALGRAVLCPFLARDIHSLLLFPEAFAMLVLSKVYLVTKGALVPEMAALGLLDETSAARADSRADPPPMVPPPTAGTRCWRPNPALRDAGDPGGRPGHRPAPDRGRPGHPQCPARAAGVVVRVRLRPTGRGHPQARGMPPPCCGSPSPSSPPPPPPGRDCPFPIDSAGGAPADDGAPGWPGARSKRRFRPPSWSGRPTGIRPGRTTRRDLAAFRPIADTEVILALMPMSVLKALVGFATFLFAFGLRRSGAATWWFGLVLGALTAGALVGVLLVAWIRRVLGEQQMLTGSLWLVVAVTTIGAFYPSRWYQAVVAFGIGMAGAVAKPSFDALVQRHVRESNQGRAFARFETRFQLMWVVGSFVPVVLSLPVAGGNLVMAVAAAVGAVIYMSSRRAVHGAEGHPR